MGQFKADRDESEGKKKQEDYEQVRRVSLKIRGDCDDGEFVKRITGGIDEANGKAGGGCYVLQQDQQQIDEEVLVDTQDKGSDQLFARDNSTMERVTRDPTLLREKRETIMTSPDEMISVEAVAKSNVKTLNSGFKLNQNQLIK